MVNYLIISKTLCFCSAITVLLHSIRIIFLQNIFLLRITQPGLLLKTVFSWWHGFEAFAWSGALVACSQQRRLRLWFSSIILLVETCFLFSLSLESLDTPPPDLGTPAGIRILLRQSQTHMAALVFSLLRLFMLFDSMAAPMPVLVPRGKEEVEG
jgi:hypothetical protein